MLYHLDFDLKKITKRPLNEQTNNIFHVFHLQKFCTIMLVLGYEYEKKIQSETLKKSQFQFFSENPTFCGSSFVLWVRGGRFQNFDTRIGSYS